MARLATHLHGTIVTLISYPLAPDNPVQVSLPQLKKLYHTLLRQSAEKDERVIIGGDSSGGNIALALTLWALEESDPDTGVVDAPAAIMAISPSTDLRHEDPEIMTAGKYDPILTFPFIQSTSSAWSTGNLDVDQLANGTEWSFDDPRVSPILARMELLAQHQIQVHGVVGTYDVLAPEAVRFRDRCREVGVRGKWLHWDGQMHCFPLAFSYGLRESSEAADWIVAVLQQT